MRRSAVALTVLLSLAPAIASVPAHAQTEQAVAQTRFAKGRDLFIAADYAKAVVEFRAAADLVESPNTRLYIARCEKELGHLARAYVEYQRAATEAADRAATDPRYASTADAAKQEGASIEPKLGHLVVNGPDLPKDVVLTVGGETTGAAALGVPAPVDPGRVVVTASAKGRKPFEKSVRVTAGEQASLTVTLEPESGEAPPPEVQRVGGGVRVAGFVIGGVGVVGMVLFTGFAVVAQSRFNQLQSECGNHCDASYQPSIDEGKRNQLIANVSLGVGAALLVTGVIMVAVGGPKTVATTPRPEEASRLLPLFGPSADGHGFSAGVFRAF